jgi:carboxyl-terminal processing protease
MQRRAKFAVVVWLSTALAAAVFAAIASPTPAQVGDSGTGSGPAVRLPDAAAQVDAILRRGRQYEAVEQWGEALAHYEDALREFPQDRALHERYEHARIQLDVARRSHDASFARAVDRLDSREALAVYAEVLLKVDAHFVVAPKWSELGEYGARTLSAALGNKAFTGRYLRQADAADVEEFRQVIRRLLARSDIQDRHDLRDAAARVAESAESRLGLSPAATILEFAAGAAAALDPYSTYLTADQLREVFSQIEGNFVGLGVEIKAAEGALSIENVIAGSPAARAGLRAGNRILAVDGRSTRHVTTDGAAALLQGNEGTFCTLSIVDQDGSQRDVRVRRAHVEVPSVEEVKLIDRASGVGYFRLTSFQKTTSRDVDAALWQLHREGMRSLVVDLRGNPGGLLSASVEVADKFLASGTIVSTRGRSPQEDFNYTAHRVGTWGVPLVVLVDGDSASASEIFAAAIQDHHRGTIVGRRSYGKGSVQGIFPLHQSNSDLTGGVRLTTARFYGPSGRPISGAGIAPDVIVQRTAKPVDDARSPQAVAASDADVEAAVEVARQKVARR